LLIPTHHVAQVPVLAATKQGISWSKNEFGYFEQVRAIHWELPRKFVWLIRCSFAALDNGLIATMLKHPTLLSAN